MSEPKEDTAPMGESAAASRQKSPAYRPLTLAGVLLLVVVLVATGPLWAPLLPWDAGRVGDEGGVEARLSQLAAAQQQSQQTTAAATAALQALDRRIAALEANPGTVASDIAELRQQLARMAGIVAVLTTRIDAIDKTARSEATSDPTDIALVLTLLQIHDAVEEGRPFTAAYETLAALARTRPEIAAAATPLAEPAATGVAARAVLANRLRELAGAIATAGGGPANPSEGSPTATPDWTDQALSRLRGLVTIRRVGEDASGSSVATAVNTALRALAGGDIAGAVSALDQLTGAPAETAKPWLGMAKERLAVETALQRVEALLVARLGTAAAAASSGPPR